MDDRRRGERFELWIPVQFGKDERTPDYAMAYDISEGGIRLSTARSLDVGSELIVRFRMYPDDGVERLARGRIVRSERNQDNPLGPWPYRVAIAFETPVPELESAIRRTIELREQGD